MAKSLTWSGLFLFVLVVEWIPALNERCAFEGGEPFPCVEAAPRPRRGSRPTAGAPRTPRPARVAASPHAACPALPPTAPSFGLVPIPVELRAQFIIGAGAMLLFCSGWERLLRSSLPAPRPPPRGYLLHKAELARARAAAGHDKKRQ
jgi:hypothetical protein